MTKSVGCTDVKRFRLTIIDNQLTLRVDISRVEFSLVRESIANPCMDFQKFLDINMGIHDFLCQSSIIHTSVDIRIDIQVRISLQGHSAMDIRKQCISINGYP